MIDVSDCQCVACRGALLAAPLDGAAEIVEARFSCIVCGKTYDQVWGAPFFLEYGDSDFMGLVEIAANAGLVSPHSPEDLELFYALLAGYHAAEDKAAFCEEAGPGYGPWLPVRYNEWLAVEKLVGDDAWAGLKILDVGAGLGFDSYRHVRAGAHVTALEFSPVLAREGKRTLPMIRWIGGAAHALPFADASFDAVFCNAALHHLSDIPASIEEMLRVLRPGGVLITSGDPFRTDAYGDDIELLIFNSHPGVLLGVNEQTPPFRDFMRALEATRTCIEPRLFTQGLHDHNKLVNGSLDEFREWSFDADRSKLAEMSGGLAMKIKLVAPVARPAARLDAGKVRPAALASWLDDQSRAMAKLVAMAPAQVIDAPFPGRRGDKFQLLNGWRAPTGAPWREGYRRARWYLRRRVGELAVEFQLRSAQPRSFDILLNGAPAGSASVPAGEWSLARAELETIAVGQVFTLEIRMNETPDSFEEGLFQVRRRRLVGGRRTETADYEVALHAGLDRVGARLARLRGRLGQRFRRLLMTGGGR